jgi:hypothetical protein
MLGTEQTADRIHNADPNLAESIIRELSPGPLGEANRVLVIYRDKYKSLNDDRNFQLMEIRVLDR